MTIIKKAGLFKFLFCLVLIGLYAFNANAQPKGKHNWRHSHKCSRDIDINITADKEDDYIVGEEASFDIEMTRHNKPANIKLKQIEATFPNVEVPVSLTKVSKGKFKYISDEFE
ncbi:MAG: hypothetical protein KAV18_04455, partial [Candidatus Omnitrophica bacterium]|nr:hypothetical protein [Candidatus Omnitrophota bacterium]